MSKSIYDEALEELKELDVILYYDVSKIGKAIKHAQKQDELLNKIKEIVDRQDDSYISSMLEESQRYYEIKELMIKELENDK